MGEKVGGIGGRLGRWLLGFSPERVTSGFPWKDPQVRERLSTIMECIAEGYHGALETREPEAIVDALEAVPLEDRGFAYEGAAMGFCILDGLTPWNRRRFSRFLAGPAEKHCYLAQVGAGLAAARLHQSVPVLLKRLDPIIGWMGVDGFGFHEAFFKTGPTVREG